MSYLFNKLKPKAKYHEWVGIEGVKEDTFCHLWANGGINRKRKGWVVVNEVPEGREMCHMCSQAVQRGEAA